MLKLMVLLARVEKKLDHLTGLVEEVLAYLDGLGKDDQKRSGDEWKDDNEVP